MKRYREADEGLRKPGESQSWFAAILFQVGSAYLNRKNCSGLKRCSTKCIGWTPPIHEA